MSDNPMDKAVGAALEVPGQKTVLDVPQPSLPKSVRLKVYGEEKDVPFEDLLTLAQKGMAADQRFQEASTMVKEAEADKAFKADCKAMQEGDLDAFRRAGAALGIPGDYVEEAAQQVWDHFEGDDSDGSEGQGRAGGDDDAVTDWQRQRQGAQDRKPPQIGYSDLSPEMRRIALTVESERIGKEVQKAIDKDDVIGYYMTKAPPEKAKAVRGLIDREIKGHLARTGQSFGDGEVLQEVMPEVRKVVEAFQPERSTPPLGLGPAPGDGGGIGVHPDKKPEHVPSTGTGGMDAFAQHLEESINYEMAKDAGR